MIGYLILMAVISIVAVQDVVDLARLGQLIACAITLPLFKNYSKYLGERPALNKLPDKGGLVAAGFKQILNTFHTIGKTNPMVARFLIGLSFVDAANSSCLNLLVLYCQQQLKSDNTTVLVAVAGISTIPGAFLGR